MTFLVELYASHPVERAFGSLRVLGSVHVPDDETCLYLVEAESEDAVRRAGRRAGVELDRVVHAIQLCAPTTQGVEE